MVSNISSRPSTSSQGNADSPYGPKRPRSDELSGSVDSRILISLRQWAGTFKDLPDGIKEEIVPRQALIQDMLEIRHPATREEEQRQILQYHLLKHHTSDPKNKNNLFLQKSMQKGHWLLFHMLLKNAVTIDAVPLLEGAIIAGNDKAFVKVLEKTSMPVGVDTLRLIAEYGQPEKLEQILARRLGPRLTDAALNDLRTLAARQQHKIREFGNLTPARWRQHLQRISDSQTYSNQIQNQHNRLNLIALAHTPGMPINEPFDERSGEIVLHLAVRHDHADVVEKLLRRPDINVNQRNDAGISALHIAAQKHQPSIIGLLLNASGVNINPITAFGQTPLTVAIINNNQDSFRVLVNTPGCNIHRIDQTGMTALHWAAMNKNPEMLGILLNKPGVRVNHQTVAGQTALHIALRNKAKGTAELLLNDVRTNIHLQDSNGQTPLHLAAKKNLASIVSLLLNRPDIQVNVADRKGLTPLHLAAEKNLASIVSLLLNRPDIQVNVADRMGLTPLHLATDPGTRQLLLQHGAHE